MSHGTDDLPDDVVLGYDRSVWDDARDPEGFGPHAAPDPAALAPLLAALDMAGRGGHIFPCHTPRRNGKCSCPRRSCDRAGKHPRTANGLTDATNDPAAIRRWWGRWPDANVAIRTGSVSGVVVIDIERDGFESFAIVCARHDAQEWVPDTWAVATGGGGGHLYLAHPGPHVHIKTTAGVLAPGVDVRGDGGYAILPPSLHASGTRYAWAEGLAPWEVDLAPIPPWLLVLLVDSPRPSRPTTSGRPRDVVASGPIPEGERNATLASLAGSMRRRGFSERAIAAALGVENAARCQPPLDAEEVATIAASVARYAPEPPPSRFVFGGSRESTVRVAGVEVAVRPREGRRG